jgi:hypothetical protein
VSIILKVKGRTPKRAQPVGQTLFLNTYERVFTELFLFYTNGLSRTFGRYMVYVSHLGGARVSVLVIGLKVLGFKPAEAMDFKDDKDPQHTFLLKGSKAGGLMT